MSADRDPEDTAKHDAFSAFLENQRQEAQRLRRQADDSIAAARLELDEIETSLARAFGGDEHVDVGEVKGVNAQAIFSAVGTLRRIAEMERAEAEKVAVAAQRAIDPDRQVLDEGGEELPEADRAERAELVPPGDGLFPPITPMDAANDTLALYRERLEAGDPQATAEQAALRELREALDASSGGRAEEKTPEHRARETMLEQAHAELDRAGVPRYNEDDHPPQQSVRERVMWLVSARHGAVDRPAGQAPEDESAKDHARRAKQRLTKAEVELREDPDDSFLRAEHDRAGLEEWAASRALERLRPSSEPDLPVSEQEVDAPDRDDPPAAEGATEIKELRDHDPGDRTRAGETYGQAADRDALRMRERVHERPPADLGPPAPEL